MRAYLVGKNDPYRGNEFEIDLSSFNYFRRSTAERLLEHGARLVLLEGDSHDFYEVIDLNGSGFSAFRMGNAVIIADENYPRHVACSLAKQINEGESLKTVLAHARRPDDIITQCGVNAAETLDIACMTVEKLIERGHKIEELVKKTQELEKHAIQFRKTTRKTSKWCCSLQ